MEASVSEIHRYPLRPPGYVEPLFVTPESRAEIAEHLLGAPWLSRASESVPEASGESGGAAGAGGHAAHAVREPVLVKRVACGRVEILRPSPKSPKESPKKSPKGSPSNSGTSRRCSWSKPWRRRRVIEVISRWREVSSWWSEDDQVDRLLFRVAVEGGAIVDLALDLSDRSGDHSGDRSGASGEWMLVGIAD